MPSPGVCFIFKIFSKLLIFGNSGSNSGFSSGSDSSDSRLLLQDS